VLSGFSLSTIAAFGAGITHEQAGDLVSKILAGAVAPE
jgi:hypothetical protein